MGNRTLDDDVRSCTRLHVVAQFELGLPKQRPSVTHNRNGCPEEAPGHPPEGPAISLVAPSSKIPKFGSSLYGAIAVAATLVGFSASIRLK